MLCKILLGGKVMAVMDNYVAAKIPLVTTRFVIFREGGLICKVEFFPDDEHF